MGKALKSYRDIPGCYPGTSRWAMYWRQHPLEHQLMLEWKLEHDSTHQREKTRREKLEEDLKAIFAEFTISSFLIHLAQLLAKHHVEIRVYGEGIRVTWLKDGGTFHWDDDEFLDLTGMDNETLGYVRDSVRDKKKKGAKTH
jgi:hypothetical protein